MAALLVAGCLGPADDADPGVDTAECVLGGPTGPPPSDRSAFNLTAEHLERFPTLATMLESEARVAAVPCTEGVRLLDALASEGADVVFREVDVGHDVYLRWEDETIHAVLQATL